MVKMEKTLYQLNSNGRPKVWKVKVEKITDSLSNIVITHGLEGGKMVVDITPIIDGKNQGKINETTVYEQAVKDAETEYNKKVKKGYVEDITQIKAKGETHSIKEPMKGYPYHPKGKEMKAKTLDELGIRAKKVGIQRKLDGFRYRLHLTSNTVVYYSSGGDIVPGFPHITDHLLNTFQVLQANDSSLTEMYLDGEIYVHNKDIPFEMISSACGTRVHITPEKAALREKMDFYLFDIISDLPYAEGRENRRHLIKPFYGGPIKKVETIYVQCDDEVIEKYFNQFLSEGYEGLMIRQLDMPYEFKRTKQLTKYKPFIDEEYEVIGFKESILLGTLGSFECKMADGKKFSVNPMGDVGSDKAKQEIWDNRKNYIGKWLHCRFLEYTEEGVPRHPRGLYFRKGKSKD